MTASPMGGPAMGGVPMVGPSLGGGQPAGGAGPAVPQPPPGPGVQPPFAAPPTDGTKQRRWLAVGLTGAAALIVCVGGLFGLGGIVVLSTQVARDDAVAAVTDYLNALRDHQYGQAYDQLCDSAKRQVTRDSFQRSQSRGPAVTMFTVGEAQLAEPIVVPATVHYDDQTVDTVRYVIAQDQSTGELHVCGEDD